MNEHESKPHILIETSSFDRGGLEKVVLDSAILFRTFGYKVTIISTGTIGLLGEQARSEGIAVYGFKSRRKMSFFLLRHRPIVALSHFADFGYPVYRLLRIPNITFIHNVYAFLDSKSKKQIIKNDKFVSRYISVSKTATLYAVNKLQLAPQKIETIPNGIIVSNHESSKANTGQLAIPTKLEIKEEDFVFLNVAAYNLHKGHYLMAAALKEVIKIYPSTKILCIGAEVYPPHLMELKNYLQEHGLAGNMILAGHFANPSIFYLRANCFLLPSFIEGWSIAMTEAMFYEVPMILTAVGGAPEVIFDNDIGIMIPNEYGDVTNLDLELLNELTYSPQSYHVTEILRDAMIDMIENEKKWKSKAKASRKRVIESHDFELIVRKYIDQINNVTDKKGRT
jgi:glycosyltransferase involved in cell wall biosynthesis